MATLNNTAYTINPLLRNEGSEPFLDVGVARMFKAKGTRAGVSPTPTATVSPTSVPSGETVAETYARGQAVLGSLSPTGTSVPPPITAGSTTSVLGAPNYLTDPGTIDQFQREPNEDQIRRQQMKLFQAQIDATNQVYDDILNQERLAGQGRLGTQRAMGARGGILGSDFAGAQRATTEQFNLGQERGIQAERQAKIGSIMGEMRSAVADELRAKREARQSGYENYVAYLSSADERKATNAQRAASAILAAGLDPSQMDPSELAAIAKEGGLTTDQIIYSYRQEKAAQEAAGAESDLKTRKTEAEIAKIEADIASGKIKTIGEGTMLYNIETGETFKNPKTYAPTAASGLKLGGNTLDQQSVADVHQTLNESRGQDGYADTGLYMDQFNGFVALGGDPKDFIKEYSPDIYINPNDPTRSFLQTAMKKPASDNLFLGSLGGLDIGSAIAEASSGS